MGGLVQDLRFALRQLRKSPVLTAVIVLTLALGIGATSAMFSVVDRALFRSLPYPHADQLVSVGVIAPIIDGEFLFAGSYLAWRREQTPFSGFTSSTGVNDCDLSDERPLRLTCVAVESTFLPTFGIQPVVGRNFTKDEDWPNAPRVALISYGLWQSRFAGDPGMVGRTISLDGKPTRIIGVLPSDFEFPTLAHTSAIVPEALDESMVQRNELGPVVRVYGRMKTGVGIEAAAAQLRPLFQKFVQVAPPPFRKELRLAVRPIRDLQIHDWRRAAWLLLASALAVLLIGCANAASLVLALSTARRHEQAVRAALGAGRVRLFQQRFTESVLLAIVGGVVGCALAWVVVHALVAFAPADIPRLGEATIDSRVLLFTLLLSLATATIFGAVPALEKPAMEALVVTSSVARRKRHFRKVVLVTQVAMTVILLASALLFLRSLRNLQNRRLGMNTQNVVTADLTLGEQRYSDAAARLAFFDELERRLKQLPGLTAIALSDSLPPDEPTRTMPFFALRPEGHPPLTPEQGTGGVVRWRSVTPRYFSVLGIPLIRGRGFTDEDRSRAGWTAVILNQVLAQRFFPGEDPVGRTIVFGGSDEPRTSAITFVVVGLAGNTENEGLAGAVAPEYYVIRRHNPEDIALRSPNSQRIRIVARSPLDAHSVAREIGGAVARLDASLPVNTTTLKQAVYRLAERPRFSALLLSVFAAMGVLLACAGIYALVSLLVGQSAHEIAIHMALGAKATAVTRRMVFQACISMGIGALAGTSCSLTLARWMNALLFGIKPTDPATLAEAALALLALGMLAAYIPARRAARVDPMDALRYE